jgi:hypothetical protein
MTDFKIQHYTTTVTSGASPVDVSIDSVASYGAGGKAFVVLNSVIQSNSGPNTPSTTVYSNRPLGVSVAFTSNSNVRVSMEPNAAPGVAFRVSFSVWEYTGIAGGPNEWVVRNVSSVALPGNGFFPTNPQTGTISITGASNVNDLVAVSNGIFNTQTDQSYDNAMATIEITNINTATVTRGGHDSQAFFKVVNGTLTYHTTIVEFIGSNWNVQQYRTISGTITGAGSDVTVSISDVSDWAETFMFSTNSIPINTPNLNTCGYTIRPGANTTSLRLRLDSGASSPTLHKIVAFIIQNSSGLIEVEHDDSITGNASAFATGDNTKSYTVEDAYKGLEAMASIATSDSSGANTNYPSAHKTYQLTSSTNFEMYRGRNGETGEVAYQIIKFNTTVVSELPTGDIDVNAYTPSVVITENQFIVINAGIPSEEEHGTPQLNLICRPTDIVSEEVVNECFLELYIIPDSIITEEAFGVPDLTTKYTIYPTGPPSEEAFGNAQLNLNILPASIDSEEAFGDHELLPTVIVEPTSIDSEEAFGSHQLNHIIESTSIESEEAFGSHQLNTNILPASIDSEEAFGNHTLETEIIGTGIPSEEAFGIPNLILYVQPESIDSEEAFWLNI